MRNLVIVVLVLTSAAISGLWWLHDDSHPVPLTLTEAVKLANSRDRYGIDRHLDASGADRNLTTEFVFLRGVRSLLNDRPESALNYFKYLKPEGELQQPLLRFTGEALYRSGELEPAERCLLTLLALDLDNADAHMLLAAIDYDLGRMESSLRHLGDVVRLDPNRYRCHQLMGVIYADFGQHVEASESFEKALAATKDPSERWDTSFRLAEVFLAVKDFKRANSVLEGLPESVRKLEIQAECFWNNGDGNSAVSCLQKASERDPLSSRGQLLRARIELEANNPRAAVSLLESLAIKNAASEECQYLLAMCYRRLGDEVLYKQHIARTEEIKSLKTQLTELSSTAMESPKDAEVRLSMSRVCDQLGMREMAEVWRKAASQCDSNTLATETLP